MRTFHFVPLLFVSALVGACSGDNGDSGSSVDTGQSDYFFGTPESVDGLKTPASFASVDGNQARSAAVFGEMAKVLTHPRCMNCHPRGDSPLQGDEMVPHNPPVMRGAGGMGTVGMMCSTCHGAENVSYTGATGSIPGHEPWALAPASMGWVGVSVTEICEQIKDPERNGGRDLEAILEHHAEDGLVGWAWNPGEGRTPTPGTQEVFGDLTAAWIGTGAHCPTG